MWNKLSDIKALRKEKIITCKEDFQGNSSFKRPSSPNKKCNSYLKWGKFFPPKNTKNSFQLSCSWLKTASFSFVYHIHKGCLISTTKGSGEKVISVWELVNRKGLSFYLFWVLHWGRVTCAVFVSLSHSPIVGHDSHVSFQWVLEDDYKFSSNELKNMFQKLDGSPDSNQCKTEEQRGEEAGACWLV